jgi:hypothetical protein
MFMGHGGAECELDVTETGVVVVDCAACRALGGFRWRDVFLLLGGLSIIGVGFHAALMKSQKSCQIYGMVMLFYGFVVGLTAILTGLQCPVISAAASEVMDNEACKKIAYMMADNVRYHSVFYGFNCVLDCLGAVYAIQSKQLFDISDTEWRHERIRESDSL